MFKRTASSRERAMAERLQREARESRPEFSEALHERICCAIGRQRQSAAVVRPRRLPSPPAFGWALAAVAAACVIAGVAVQWRFGHPAVEPVPAPGTQLAHQRAAVPVPRPADSVASFGPVVDLANRVPARIPALVDSTVRTGQWAYLDHDARLTVELLKNRLRFDVGSWPTSGAEDTP